jgi:uncharacterized ParB-like nuclease family protein
MTPEAITLLFKEATEAFILIDGKPLDNDLLAIRETLLLLLTDIPYDLLGHLHLLTGIITDATTYAADHGSVAFVCPTRLPLYDATIPIDATKVVQVRAETAHQARVNDYASFEAAEHGDAKFLMEVVNNLWINNLKDADTFYTKVTALQIVVHNDANSGGLHSIDMLTLRLSMQTYYKQADGIPQYIAMLEDAQKKEKQANMPIVDAKLVMMALAAVLAVQHFPRKWKIGKASLQHCVPGPPGKRHSVLRTSRASFRSWRQRGVSRWPAQMQSYQ